MAIWAVITTFLFGTLMGWVVHWALHQRWSGFANRAHMTHHVRLYPPADLVSEQYRDAGKDNTVFIFTPLIAFGFLVFLGVLYAFLGASLWLIGGLAVEGLLIGVAHDTLHTLFHLHSTRLLRLRWFLRLRDAHFYHHRNMKRNYGVFFFGWDRFFGTFRGLSKESR